MPSARRPQISVTTNPDVSKLAAMVDSFPRKLFAPMKTNVEETFAALKDVMVKRTSEGPLFKRTGRLKRSWSSQSRGTSLRTFTTVTGSSAYYSVMHETGGTFTPFKAKWFWIPLGPNIKTNRTAKVSPKKAVDFLKQKFWRTARKTKGSGDAALSGSSNMILNEHGEPVYLLVKSIHLNAVLGFQPQSGTFVARATTKLHVLAGQLAKQEFAAIKH